MTKKDFELIAKVLLKMKPLMNFTIHEMLICQFILELEQTNPRFDKERFRQAARGLTNE